MHGPPDVPNDGVAGRGLTLRPGLVIAIEPWFLAGSPKIVIDRDGWTIRSVDGSRGVHVEHTVAVTAALAGMTTVTFLLVFDHRLRHAPRCHAVRIWRSRPSSRPTPSPPIDSALSPPAKGPTPDDRCLRCPLSPWPTMRRNRVASTTRSCGRWAADRAKRPRMLSYVRKATSPSTVRVSTSRMGNYRARLRRFSAGSQLHSADHDRDPERPR
jgi:hypothetical protein